MTNILMYSDKVSGFNYGEFHPFKPSRAKQFLELINRYSLIFEKNQKIIEPVPITKVILQNFHTKEYLDILRKINRGSFSIEMLNFGIGTSDNPVIKGILDFSINASSGTYNGGMMLLNNEARFVFNPLGGFHHAGSAHGEGFCYINDLAVTIKALINKGVKVAYIDIDVHHGNGVQDAFYDTDAVLTISLHETGLTLYPWSGFENEIGTDKGVGYNVNIPLLQYTDDEVYIYAFESIIPPLIDKFKPDIVIAEIGGDTHMTDPLAHLKLTSNGYLKVISHINHFSPKLLATGGGGYNPFKTAALWTLAWAECCNIEPEDQYAGIVGGMMFGPETDSGTLTDKPYFTTGPIKDTTFLHAKNIVEYIKNTVFPIHQI